jgi:hypothetical protein
MEAEPILDSSLLSTGARPGLLVQVGVPEIEAGDGDLALRPVDVEEQ